MSKKKFYQLNMYELESSLETDLNMGLTEENVRNKYELYEKNIISQELKQSLVVKFLYKFLEPTTIILLGAGIISLFLQEYKNAIAITGLLFLNSIIGFIQEYKAESALEAIKNITAPQAKVIREGKQQEIKATNLVLGDIVVLEAGDYVPADIRLIEVSDIKIDESALTGESIPVEKIYECLGDYTIPIAEQRNMAFMSTLVTYGRAKGLVVNVGKETEIGKVASMLNDIKSTKTPLQLKLSEISKTLAIMSTIICLIIFAIGVIEGQNIYDIAISAFSLAIAAIPEGMPLIVTIILAMGIRNMAKNKAIIKSLTAIETSGAANLVLTDKTGTLTQNNMTIMEVFVDNRTIKVKDLSKEDDSLVRLLEMGVLNNDTKVQVNKSGEFELLGEATEVAMSQLAINYGLNPLLITEKAKRINEIPFDSNRKMMTTVHQVNSKKMVIVKGAPEEIIKITSKIELNNGIIQISEEMKERILQQNNKFSENVLRVIAIGYKIIDKDEEDKTSLENDIIFKGLFAMMDPPKKQVKETIKEFHKAGIDTVMITGDSKLTATAIAMKLNISKNINQTITGIEIDELSKEELNSNINSYRVFARVTPEHKLKIVEAFQNKGNIVIMTGDGVNDAPALKKSDIGVAMGVGGTEVAKEASEMILGDDNFSTISYAIKYGRQSYDNIKKAIHIMLCGNISEIVALFLATTFGNLLFGTPVIFLSAIQILWFNVVSDTVLSIALGMNPIEADIMYRKPRKRDEAFFGNGLGFTIGWHGLMIGIFTFIAFVIGVNLNGNLNESLMTANTMAFMTLSFSQFLHGFNLISDKESIFNSSIFSNKALIFVFLINSTLQILLMMIPFLREEVFNLRWLTLREWSIVVGISILPVIIVEIQKLFIRRKYDKYKYTRRIGKN